VSENDNCHCACTTKVAVEVMRKALRRPPKTNIEGLQFEVAFWAAPAVGSAAQLASAHCPNERTLDQQ